MARRKAARNCAISPWSSAKPDGRENRFTQIGNSFMLSEKVHGLSSGARWLYIGMVMECGGKREFVFTHGAAKKYGVPPSSYDRYVKELKDGGFIERLEDDDLAQYAPGRYRFDFKWKGIRSDSALHFGDGQSQNFPHFGGGKAEKQD